MARDVAGSGRVATVVCSNCGVFLTYLSSVWAGGESVTVLVYLIGSRSGLSVT